MLQLHRRSSVRQETITCKRLDTLLFLVQAYFIDLCTQLDGNTNVSQENPKTRRSFIYKKTGSKCTENRTKLRRLRSSWAGLKRNQLRWRQSPKLQAGRSEPIELQFSRGEPIRGLIVESKSSKLDLRWSRTPRHRSRMVQSGGMHSERCTDATNHSSSSANESGAMG